MARAPRSSFSSRIDCRRRIALRTLRLNQLVLAADRLDQAVRGQRRLGLDHVLDLGPAAGRDVERPDRGRLDAVELAAAPDGDDPVRRLDHHERQVGPREALERRVHLEAGAGAAADGVDPRQPPVLQVVVAELRVVRDVGEVGEDLLARPVDRDGDADGVHRARKHSQARRAGARGRRAGAPASGPTRCGRAARGAAGGTARRPRGRRTYGRSRRPAEYDGSARSRGGGR